MIFKLVLLFILLYLVLRTAGNLIRAVVGNGVPPARMEPPRPDTPFYHDPRRSSAEPPQPVRRPPPASRGTPAQDVEDAKWKDL